MTIGPKGRCFTEEAQEQERDRYFVRQHALEGFGRGAQQRLADKTALVAGLGGTGSVLATQLALAGIGNIVLVDRDVVSLENLHRQPIFSRRDIGMSKAEVAAGFLRERAPPGLNVEYFAESLDSETAMKLTRTANVAVDCLDNMAGRHDLNFACVRRAIPMVHTGATGWEASVGVFFSGGGSACFECLFPRGETNHQHDPLPTCEEVGTLGPVTSIAASVGAAETIAMLTTGDSPLLGRLMVYDVRRGAPYVLRLQTKRREGCTACGGLTTRGRRQVTALCGGAEFYVSNVYPPEAFRRIQGALGTANVTKMGQSLLIVRLGGGKEMVLFRKGGVLVRGVKSAEDAREATRLLPELGAAAKS